MVKSYQGVRKEDEKDYTPPMVKDYMSKQLITFTPTQTINEVVGVLMYRNISGGPVVNEKGELIGIISEGDCLKEIMRGHYNNDLTMSAHVEEVMVRSVMTVSINETVWDVALKFLKLKMRRFPVTDGEKLVGQVSQRDIMKAVEEMRWQFKGCETLSFDFEKAEKRRIVFYNINMQLLKEEQKSESNFILNTSNLPKGIIILQIISEEGKVNVEKLIKR